MSELLLRSLKDFYTIEKNYNEFYEIINSKSFISLRLIDWFVTNYSKKYNVIFILNKEKNTIINEIQCENKEDIQQINVFQDYKSQLKAFSKKKFDPFCRRERINFFCNDINVETTVGQLNFFRWAIKNRITDYIRDNKEIIEDDMNTSLKVMKDLGNKNKNGRKSRQELSKSALRGLNKNKLTVCITFD